MRKEHPYRFWWPALLTAGLLLSAGCANAETTMTVTGPVVTTGDYLQARPGLEDMWTYYLTNTSTVGDVNNMIAWQINAGRNNNILNVEFEKLTENGSLPNINFTYLTNTSTGFTGLVPPVSDENNPDPSTIVIKLITPATTPSAPGLAVATAVGGGYNVPFPPVPVEVPYLAAGCAVEWAEQAVGGEREFRYRVSNPGTPPLTTVVLPAGRQHGVSTALAPAGWTATLGALATTFSGSLGHGQSLRLALRSAQPAGEPLLAGIGTGTQTLWAAVGVPGPSQPRPLATWTDATGFHARFLVRPGHRREDVPLVGLVRLVRPV